MLLFTIAAKDSPVATRSKREIIVAATISIINSPIVSVSAMRRLLYLVVNTMNVVCCANVSIQSMSLSSEEDGGDG